MLFGLLGGQPRTLEEVGRAFGVTRERIRQIESKTLCKLPHPSRARQLRDYLDQLPASNEFGRGGSSGGTDTRQA